MRNIHLPSIAAKLAAAMLCFTSSSIQAHSDQTGGILVAKAVFHKRSAPKPRGPTKQAVFAITIINYGDVPTVPGRFEITEQLPDNVTLNHIDYDGYGSLHQQLPAPGW